ncbi:PREDICTED: MADS-box protein AGL42-like [Nicotiana attenuata]|uniref:Mads-box protein soc1 n=1 Tax=Nicotiana attenuata TaxID=49451 RepID=A0A314L1C4_NICAT|nr:PREDICTED: MADS-box protein AGL42-like [Nicotiana attenuata]OIT35275.1 mads-box protein soc1 [Nicotiana attenuata]
MQHLKHETANMAKKIEILEVSKRKLMGQGLGPCSMDELQEIDSKLERSLENIRARKAQLFNDEVESLKARESLLLEENKNLREKCRLMPTPSAPAPAPPTQLKERGNCSKNTQNLEVETELFIGLPAMRCS